MLRPVRHADKVGELVADHLALDQEVVLVVHELLERPNVNRTFDSDEELRALEIRREPVELTRLAAVLVVHFVELFAILLVRSLQSVELDHFSRDHACDDREQGQNFLAIDTPRRDLVALAVAHEVEQVLDPGLAIEVASVVSAIEDAVQDELAVVVLVDGVRCVAARSRARRLYFEELELVNDELD